jgi:HEAT repeat
MRKRRKLILLFLGCGIAAILLFTLSREREPRYQEKSLSEWISILEHGDPAAATGQDVNAISYQEAESGIRNIGTQALPFLIKWVQYEEKPWRSRLETLCDKLPDRFARRLNGWVAGHGYERQQGAFSALYVLGPEAAPAIPTLIRLVQTQPLTIQYSLTVLAAIGGDGLTPVLRILDDQASPDRLTAIKAIVSADFEAKRPLDPIVVSTLINCLTDTNREVAFCAAQILCRYDSHKELGMKTFIDGLQLEDKKLRRHVVEGLRISLKHGYSVPALLQFLQDTNSLLSPYSAGALGEMADDGVKLPDTVLPALTNSLHDPRPKVRSYAADAVAHFKAAAEPALLDLWTDPDEGVRRSATNTFFELPSFYCLRILAEAPGWIPRPTADMFATRYGINPLFPAATNLLHHPDIRIRQMATNAFRMVEGSNTLNQTTENASR